MESRGRGAKVMILDTGVSAEVFPFEARKFVSSSVACDHGTRVFKVIAGDDGISPACEAYVAEVVGTGTWGAVAGALRWAVDLGVDVVNMSFACPASDADADKLLDQLNHRGVLLVAAYNRWLHWPHAHEAVIAVGPEGETRCDLEAPKEYPVEISGKSELFTGSSASAAVVSGIAACAKATDRSINRLRFLHDLRGRQDLRR